jgi:hypothetical protein
MVETPDCPTVILEVEPKASHMLGKYFTVKLHPQLNVISW